MADVMHKAAAKTQVAVQSWVEDRAGAMRTRQSDRGQTAIEYLGIAVVIAAIIIALAGTDIGTKIKDGIMQKIDEILGS